LAIIGKQSPCSRIPGDMAVRNSTASISSRALRRAFSMMSTVTPSTETVSRGLVALNNSSLAYGSPQLFGVDQKVADGVHAAGIARQDDGRGIHFGDDAGSGHRQQSLSSRS
jgi:hypothetical protein